MGFIQKEKRTMHTKSVGMPILCNGRFIGIPPLKGEYHIIPNQKRIREIYSQLKVKPHFSKNKSLLYIILKYF